MTLVNTKYHSLPLTVPDGLNAIMEGSALSNCEMIHQNSRYTYIQSQFLWFRNITIIQFLRKLQKKGCIHQPVINIDDGSFCDTVTAKRQSFTIFTKSSINLEAVVWSCSMKKVFLKIYQNSQENTCIRVYFLIKS